MKKYQVIGGQHEQYWYGESDYAYGAKTIASKHAEYWDNWAGWHTPMVYHSKDCRVIECHGWVTVADGVKTVVHDKDARPAFAKINEKWVCFDEN